MSTFVNPASRPSVQSLRLRNTSEYSLPNDSRTESQTRGLVNDLQSLDDSELEQFFSQQSDEELNELASDIDPSRTINGGLSADERRDLFNHLASALSAQESKRWRELLSEGLANEFDASVWAFASTSINTELVAETKLQAVDSDDFGSAANGLAFGSERPLALFQADPSAASSVEPVSQTPWQNHPEWSATDRAFADNAMDALALSDPIGTIAEHSALAEQFVESHRAYEQWQQGNMDKDVLLQVLRETNAAFKASPIGELQSNNFSYLYTSNTLPSELRSQYDGRKSPGGYEFGHSSWRISRGFVSLPDSVVSREVEGFLGALDVRAEPMRVIRADAERYFVPNTVVPDIDIAYLSHIRSLPTLDASQQRALADELVRIDGLLTQSGMPSRITLPYSTLISFDASLIPSTETAFAGSTRSYRLEDAPLQEIAEHLLADVLALDQTDEGREQMQDIHHALNSLNPENAGKVNDEIARTYLLLQSEIQLSSANTDRPDSIALLLERLYGQLENAGLSQIAPRLERNDKPISSESFSFADRVVFARDALAAPTSGAFTLSLEHFGQYADRETAADTEIAALFSLLDPDQQLIPNESTMQSLVGEFVTASTTATSERDYKRVADQGWQTASYILSGSESAISEDDLKSLFQWVHGDSLSDLGFRTREGYTDNQQNWRYRELGTYGNFGKEKYDFATAWLNSSREERLAYFGLSDISLVRWENAAPIIGQSIGADAQARALDRAAFGFDDVVLLGISVVAGFVIPGSIATLAPAFFGTTVGLGIQAGIGSFSSTLIITKGDVDAAVEAGGMALISGGLGEYVNNIEGFTGVIARSILNGAINELSGQEFIDGVLSSLGSEVGEAVKLRIGDNMPEFVNDFTGKTIELSIRHRGDVDLITAGLEEFVKNYAVDNVDTFLTDVVGIENDVLREPLAKAFTEFVNSDGDFDAALSSLEDSLITHVTGSLGEEALERMGGAEALHSQVFYGLAALMLDTGGDLSKLAGQADNFALSLIGDWAGTQLTQSLDAVLGTEDNPFTGALGEIARTAVAAGWEGSELSLTAFGPLADALGEVLPVGAEGATGFLSRSLEALTQSYIANNGDMQAVGQDMSGFVVDEMILAEQSRTTLKLNDRGPRVTALQQQLQEAGFFHASVDGVYDQDTVSAVNRFQDDALTKLETGRVEAEQTGNTERAQKLLDTWTRLSTERSNQVFDEASELLLSTPVSELFQSTVEPQIDETTGELVFGESLGLGATGNDVSRLQELLQQAGFSTGAIDGDFGPNTASALSAFQQQQIGYLNDVLGRTENVDTPQRQQLLGERDTLLREQQDGVAASGSWLRLADPLDLEAVAQMTSSQLATGGDVAAGNTAIDQVASILQEGPAEGWEADFDDVLVAAVGGGAFRLATSDVDDRLKNIVSLLPNYTDRQLDQVLSTANKEKTFEKLIDLIEEQDVYQLESAYANLARNLKPEHLDRFFYGLGGVHQEKFIEAVNNYGGADVQQELASISQRALLENKLPKLQGADKELMLDVGQIALDVVGIFDQTGVADGVNAGISLVRGNYFDAFISAVSMVPVFGDLAKAGRLGDMAQTVERLVSRFGSMSEAQVRNSALFQAAEPMLKAIHSSIENAQSGATSYAWNLLSEDKQQALLTMQQKIDDLLTFRNAPSNGYISSVPNNDSSLIGARWKTDDIAIEMALRLRQRAAVDEVDMWVADVPGRTVDEFFNTAYHDSSKAQLAKGAYGEMKADLYFTEELGYIPMATGHPRVTSLESGHGLEGIDGLYQKPDGEYVVIEVKPNNTGTATTNRGQQLSTPWLRNHLRQTFVDDRDLIDDILDDASRVLVNYESIRAGDLSMQLVDKSGIRTNTRFTP